jgi:hypothetical protein
VHSTCTRWRSHFQRLRRLSAGWHEIDPSDEIRETAALFLRVHPLRAAGETL